MTLLDVDVSRYSLTVDARDTIRAVLDSGDGERGSRFDEIMHVASCGEAAFAVPPSASVDRGDFRPGLPDDDDWPEIGDRHELAVLRNMERAGLAETYDLFSETIGESYLDEGRVLTVVRVLCPFTIVSVRYGWSGVLGAYADRWEITERTHTVQAGTYLVGHVGDFGMTYVGATGIDAACEGADDITDDVLFMWLVEQEGFLASSCLAGCDSCQGRWIAEAGSWHFRPDCARDVDDFDFDAIDDVDGATIACPACVTGRVGFLVV
ncbi:hypothetical protein [Salinactinospora qingdaonensis]|uniref:Uncharacterized protein n=1 Tax=Salinactinospora qingdaonensis TaxID=702744 RepID=A0ABP7FPL0_9ACTN